MQINLLIGSFSLLMNLGFMRLDDKFKKFGQTQTLSLGLIRFVVALDGGSFTLVRSLEPKVPHVLFLCWRLCENIALGYIGIQHIEDR